MLVSKNMKKGRKNSTPKISDENYDDEPYVIYLKDELLQHLVGYDHYLILDPAPGFIFLPFLQYLL